jgi:hypothetical protein
MKYGGHLVQWNGVVLPAGRKEFESLWQRLTGAGILTLPDSSTLECDTYGKDGTNYIVEINMNKTYRTYRYHDPNHAACGEAKQMVKIGEIVASEFGLQNFSLVE